MFSDRLKKARKSKGLTQEQLAEIISVERSSVGKYESANVIPSPEVLKRIANALDVSVDYMLERTNTTSTADAPAVTDDQIKVALFGGDTEVTDAMWEEVKRFAAFVKENEDKKRNG